MENFRDCFPGLVGMRSDLKATYSKLGGVVAICSNLGLNDEN